MPVLQNVKNRDRSTLQTCGPCLTCGSPNITYGDGSGGGLPASHVQYGNDWLKRLATRMGRRRKPFVFVEPGHGRFAASQRPEFVVVYRAESSPPYHVKISEVNGYKPSVLYPYICQTCYEEIEAQLNKFSEIERERQEAKAAKNRFEETWRRPAAGEFPTETGSRAFSVVRPDGFSRNILLSWRTSKRRCQGSNPAFVMIMTVGGVLAGRTLQAYDASTSRDETEERAAVTLLIDWVQRQCQDELRSTTPHATWIARKPDPEAVAWGAYGGRPAIIETVLPDGKRYIALIDYGTFENATDLFDQIGYRLVERSANTVQTLVKSATHVAT